MLGTVNDADGPDSEARSDGNSCGRAAVITRRMNTEWGEIVMKITRERRILFGNSIICVS
jgi:hypothetical protein